MKLKNFKYYANVLLLSTAISLTGCANNNKEKNEKNQNLVVNMNEYCSNNTDNTMKLKVNELDMTNKVKLLYKDNTIKNDKTKKEKKYDIHDLYIVNTKLINSSIKKGYYIVKAGPLKEGSKKCKLVTKKNKEYTKCFYNTNDKVNSWCFFQKFSSVGQNEKATFVSERHYPMSPVPFPANTENNTYLCVRANINDKHKYKKLYTLEPGTIDGNPANLKKAKKFDASIRCLEDALKEEYVQNYYTESEIKTLNNMINKVKVLK